MIGLSGAALAGHLPILHYRASQNLIDRFGMQQFPLGPIAECNYESATVACEAGDLLVLSSDGIVETEDGFGSEFGLERVERLLLKGGTASLKDIASRIMSELASFGPREDDQSLLLMRITKASGAMNGGFVDSSGEADAARPGP